MKLINIELELQDVQKVLEILGDLPTKAGVYPLCMKFKLQTEEQLNKVEPEVVIEDK